MSETDIAGVEMDDVPARGVIGELQVVDRLRREDPDAERDLVERYGARAYRVAIGITRNAADAEAVAQNALGSALEKLDTFRGDAALGAWLYRVVTTAACETVRPTLRRRADISLEDVLPGPKVEDWSPRVEDPAIRSRVASVLGAAIDDLSPEDRAVVILRDVEGLTLAEAAISMDMTVANARARLHRARLFLRKRLGLAMTAAA
ncbi:MAG TPA: RNA polymerase sigma factor [Methylomirabilota bacterium]|jgi:RNA polymerase sigma-70 factor (ECF subfamily)